MDHRKIKKIPEKNIYPASLTALKSLCGSQQTGKFLKRWEYQINIQIAQEAICMQVKKQQLELDIEQWTDFKLGKEYIKALYCHLAYLTYMQST